MREIPLHPHPYFLRQYSIFMPVPRQITILCKECQRQSEAYSKNRQYCYICRAERRVKQQSICAKAFRIRKQNETTFSN